MIFFKLKIYSRIKWFTLYLFLPLITSCTSGVKYEIFSAKDTCVSSIKANISLYNKNTYFDFISHDLWDDAVKHGFLRNNSALDFNCNQNNELEEGLGYIFFNTLRAKLHGEVDHTNTALWGNNQDDQVLYNGFRCPKPWKYETRNIKGKIYGVFYLDCVQMGEYHRFNNSIRNNHDRINSGTAPYMKVYYIDEDSVPESTSLVLNIDHLLKDNAYLIELPKALHSIKTSVLDPFIIWKTETTRSFGTSEYWKQSKHYLEYDQNNNCMCGNPFEKPVGNRVVDHIHNELWKIDWIANMKGTNMP